MSKEIALRDDALTASEVETVTFRVTRFRQGYDAQEVDDFLDRVQSEVALLTAENERLRAELIKRETTEAAPVSGSSGIGFIGGSAPVTGSADLLARRADLERDVNALEAFEREYRTRLRAWIGGMLDELDHPEDVPLPTVTESAKPLRDQPAPARESWSVEAASDDYEDDDTSEIPVIDTRWVKEQKKAKKKDKKKKKDKSGRSVRRTRDFTLPANDPHGPDPVTRPA